jgi:peptidoglycan/LPS O-acetylase OafA/YrhL
MLINARVTIPSPNNFDLIRLLAASQVLLIHVNDHLRVAVPSLITFFPGVPIFFIISGFLVTASLDRCTGLRTYAIYRALRIYPGLWLMTLATIGLLWALGHLNSSTNLMKFALYAIGQTTVFQFVSGGLGLFRSFGTGGVNGVLWTIATELQFYALLPLLFALAGPPGRRRVITLVSAFSASVFCYAWLLPLFLSRADAAGKAGFARYAIVLTYTSVLPHLFGFLIGTAFYLGFNRLRPVVEGRALLWAAAYAAFVFIVGEWLGIAGWALEQNVALMLSERVLLALFIFALAFSIPRLSDRVLQGNDISYGVYIYQMLVINAVIDWGWVNSWRSAVAACGMTCVLALLSWRLIEHPVLSLKHQLAHGGRAQ